jgi:hypothetical protein
MYMQRQRITKTGALNDDTTWRYKLPSLGKYTAFEMQIEASRTAVRTDVDAVHTLHNVISKIEMVAGGSVVMMSLTGTQVDAANYWALKSPTRRRYRQGIVGADNVINLFLMGGRSLYDTKYGFDFGKLPETYLEYTYNHHEGTADYFTADTHYVTLYGWRWMGPGQPDFRAYFRSRQLAAWTTTGTDVIKNIEIPVGNPYRWLAAQAKTRAYSLGATTKYLELKVNNGEYSPVTILSPMDWCQQEIPTYGLNPTIGGVDYLVGTAQTDLPYWFSYYDTLLAQSYGDTTGNDLKVHMLTLPARLRDAVTGSRECCFIMQGSGFQKCLRIGFDVQEDESDLLVTAGMGALDLEITEHTVTRDAAVFVQDIVSY